MREVPAETGPGSQAERRSAPADRIGESSEDSGAHPLLLTPSEYGALHILVLEMEAQGKVARTFRRLDPAQQAEVVDVVLEALSRQGPRGVTMRAVAGKLGISAASLYAYFEDREAMVAFATTAAVRISLLAASEKPDPEAWTSLGEGLRRHLATDLEFVATHWSIVKYVAQAGYRGELSLSQSVVAPVTSGMQSRVRRLLDEAVEHEELRTDVDPNAVSRVVNAMMLVLADARFVDHLNDHLQLFPDDGSGVQETIDAAIDIIARGICRRR